MYICLAVFSLQYCNADLSL